MAAIAIQQISQAGIVPTAAAASVAGDTFINNGRTFLKVINGAAAPINVTINSLVNCNQGSDHDVVVAVANGTTAYIGPFSMDRFNNSAGLASVTYSAVTTVTVAAVSL
jgi:hypothetical protein